MSELKVKKVKANKEHIDNLLKFLIDEVHSSGGDGDAFWYTKHYCLNDLENIIKDYNDSFAIGWDIERVSENQINWGVGQEWITITDSKELYEKTPDWMQIKIKY